MMLTISLLFGTTVPLAWAAVTDFRQRRIPNGIIALLAVVAALQWLAVYLQLSSGLTRPELGVNGLLLLLVILPGYLTGYLGAGDLKLVGVLALLWPPQLLLPAFAIGSILFSLISLGIRSQPSAAVAGSGDTGTAAQANQVPAPSIPMATALFTGAVLWLAAGGAL